MLMSVDDVPVENGSSITLKPGFHAASCEVRGANIPIDEEHLSISYDGKIMPRNYLLKSLLVKASRHAGAPRYR